MIGENLQSGFNRPAYLEDEGYKSKAETVEEHMMLLVAIQPKSQELNLYARITLIT